MLPKDIESILTKHSDKVAEEISCINLAIQRISDSLKTVNAVLIDEMALFAKNTNTKNISTEYEWHKESIKLREYIETIHLIDDHCTQDETVQKNLSIYDLIVLSNTTKCFYENHHTEDINANIPVLNSEGKVEFKSVLISYCHTCKRYTLLKEAFKNINGVIMCQVIDETTIQDETCDEIDIVQKQSELYKYGYNVQTKQNLTSVQRHIILASIIEANILNRRQIIDHLTTLIDRGSKIQNWKEATRKWKEDRYYVQEYKTNNLPSVIFDKIILKYSTKN